MPPVNHCSGWFDITMPSEAFFALTWQSSDERSSGFSQGCLPGRPVREAFLPAASKMLRMGVRTVIETMMFDFMGLGLIALCTAVIVTPGPRAAGLRRSDDFTTSGNASYYQTGDVIAPGIVPGAHSRREVVVAQDILRDWDARAPAEARTVRS
jgi:hypothetical protein